MAPSFDVLVVGAGPAGSTAAQVLARGGARVGLLDKARFPRDKACGDLVGPHIVDQLHDLGLDGVPATRAGDAFLRGPHGRATRLRTFAGNGFTDHGLTIPRRVFDDGLRSAAITAGAEPIDGQVVDGTYDDDGRLDGIRTAAGERISADFVIGADGSTTKVGELAGLVDKRYVNWGFAVRGYADAVGDVDPTIVFRESKRWRAFPGYGWVFPSEPGRANVGIGVGTLGQRQLGRQAAQELPAFVAEMRAIGLLAPGPDDLPSIGGWLKMGLAGTVPASGRTLLVGDAAGLVNPLQGEGIANAMLSARRAADAILEQPEQAAARYAREIRDVHADYMTTAVGLHEIAVRHPMVGAVVGRMLSAGLPPLLADAWTCYWMDIRRDAPPSASRTLARLFHRLATVVTWRTTASRAARAAMDGHQPEGT